MEAPGVVLITGAGSGIGYELARTYAGQGWAVAGLDCRPDGLAKLGEEIGRLKGRYASAVADVLDGGALAAKVAELEQALGPIDRLIACAGVGIETSAIGLDAGDMAKVIGVNLIGVSNSIAAVLPGMLRRRRGHLVALSSVASFRGLPRMLGYCASKSGLNALLEGLRVELRPYGIATTTICPSWVRTPMTAAVQHRLRDILELDYAARRIVWAIDRKKPFYAFPRRTAWTLRLLRWLPIAWQDAFVARLARQIKGA
jgi:short-subunit dehydrogenase